MENSEQLQTIEINGIKMQVDLRYARRVEEFRVGDPVKVLINNAHTTPDVHCGVIVDFEPFETSPTIVVAYIKTGWGGGLEFAYINKHSSDKYELVASSEDSMLALDRAAVNQALDNEIETARTKLRELEQKRAYFNERFGRYFSQYAEASAES